MKKERSQCCAIKQYTQTEKLEQIGRCGCTGRQKYCAKGSGEKKLKYKSLCVEI
jgi:hypothetical protein